MSSVLEARYLAQDQTLFKANLQSQRMRVDPSLSKTGTMWGVYWEIAMGS